MSEAMQEVAAVEDVVFGNTVEALFLKALGSRLTPRCYERAAAAGIDLRGKLKPFYPREPYYAAVRAVAEELFPELDPERRLFEMGLAFMSGFDQTLLGKAILAAVRLIGARRMLAKMTDKFRSSNNYMKTEMVERAPGDIELTLSQTSGAPAYFEGVLTYGLRVAGAKEVHISRLKEDGTHCTFAIKWRVID